MGYKSAELNNAEANERKNLLKIRCADLVQVTAFDAGKLTVNVKPLVKREIGDTVVSPPPILGVKVANIPLEVEVEGKKGTVTVKINPGDIGVVVYLDLDSEDSAVVYRTETPSVFSRILSSLHHGVYAVVEYFD